MVTRKTFYICIFTLFAVFLASVLYVHHSRQSDIELLQGQLKASELNAGIWKTESQTVKADRGRLQIENEQLYQGIEADTMLMDYAYGLIGAQREYIKTVQQVMSNNGVSYPEFIYKEVKYNGNRL